MKYILFMLAFVLAMTPTHVFAICSNTGATAVFVNGILNSQQDANESKDRLQRAFEKKFSDINVTFITGYNPSHLAGLGDLAQSGAQMLGSSVSDFDLKTILMQIQPEVATRKILLVGHSQGTLYTNSIYNYLVSNGVPKESIAVYNVATPAREVSGGGKYLTSSNDSLIRALATLAKKTGLPAPFSPNIDISIQPGDTESAYPGHNFIRAYLPGASDKIVSDVSRELHALRAETSAEACFTAPPSTIGYKIEGALFAIADPFAGGVVVAAKTASGAGLAAGEFLGGAIAAAGGKILNAAAVIFAFPDNAPPVAEIPESAFALSEPPRSSTSDVLTSSTSDVIPRGDQAEAGNPLVPAPDAARSSTSDVLTSSTSDVIPREAESETVPPFLQLQSVGGGSAGFGGGSPRDTIPPGPPDVASPANGFSASTTIIVFSGQAEKESIISSDFDATAATADTAGNWVLTLKDFAQGSTTIKFFSTDKSGNKSEPANREIFIDSIAPPVNLVVSECNQSLSSEGCLVATTTLQIEWSSASADLDHFEITCQAGGAPCSGFSFSPTNATSTVYVLPDSGATYIFEAAAFDKLGNRGATVETVEVETRPVVINEVAWAGTAANSADEWIELYNPTSKTIDLSQMKLKSQTDNKPSINLSGSIASGGYYLIERTDNNTVLDIAADLFTGFGNGSGAGLVNTGEVLVIEYKGEVLDETPPISACGGWCGGSAGGLYPTMERIDPEVAGTETANWGTANGIVKNGLDSAGAALTATPRARNSLHYLIAQTTTLSADRTLKQSFGTYIIKENDTFIVPAGKTLTIEPGVTVKMGGSASLEVNGTLVANGTSANNIIFTRLDPPNNWKNIRITEDSQNSSVSYAQFKYGGRYFSNTPLEQRSELSVINNSITVSNSLFENSYSDGLRLTVSNSTVTGSTFSVGTTSASNIGLEASDGTPAISQNTFSQNYQGLRLNTNTAASVQNNTFTDNLDYAVYATNAKSAFSGNSGSGNGNGKNGIALTGTISAAGGTTTLSANSLPYLVGIYPSGNPKIAAGSVLVVGAGTTWKGEANDSRFEVEGTMKLEGLNKDSILWTSLADSGPGEWYGITVSSTGYVYGGGFTLKYGGGSQSCSGCAGFSVIGGRVNLSDGRIQNNYKVGMQIYDSATSSLSNFEFLDHQTPAGNSTALVSSNSTLILSDLTFSNNLTNTSPANLY